jgi:hypothetical protein
MDAFPGNLSELRFLESYYRHTLRKPQVAADTLMRSLTLSAGPDRAVLVATIAAQLAEAAQRLVAVYRALGNRSRPVVAQLVAPLPGASEFREFAQEAGTIAPETMVRQLGLGDEALKTAEQLRGSPDLAWIAELIAAAEGGRLVIETVATGSRETGTILLTGVTPDGVVSVASQTDEADAANLADYTAELCEISRGFLGIFLEARRALYRFDR